MSISHNGHLLSNTAKQELACTHCGSLTRKPIYIKHNQDQAFCCFGCLSVYELLHDNGLEDFYKHKQAGDLFFESGPVQFESTEYSYVDDQDFLRDHQLKSLQGLRQMRFYLEGIHCTACLWLVEKLRDQLDHVHDIKLDLSTSIVTITLHPQGRFQEAVKLIASFGFKPQALKSMEDHHQLSIVEDRKDMLRIGVAAAAAMNIMLYTVSIYAGAPQSFSVVFSYLIIALSVPVVFYSAWPFYRNALASLRHRKVSLDLPISVALIYGFTRGLLEIYNGGLEFYFDTLSILVFLLLISRFTVKKWGRRGLAINALSPLIGLSSVKVKLRSGEVIEKHPDYLHIKDFIEVRPGQVIPADGILKSDKGFFQTALLTGESMPHELLFDQPVLGGYQNAGQKVWVELTQTVKSSLLGRMIEQVNNERSAQSSFAMMADKVAARLVPIIFSLSALLLLYFWWQGNLLEGERRALSLIIITCPCALGLATPLAIARSLNIARRLGIVLKNENDFERIAPIKRIILDKTGTLTKGEFNLIKEHYVNPEEETFIQSLVIALEATSEHPLAQAFRRQWQGHVSSVEMKDVKEVPGVGVCGFWNQREYKLGASQNVSGLGLGELALDFIEDGVLRAQFTLGDQVRAEAIDIVKKWHDEGFETWILSGDKKAHVLAMAKKLGIPEERAFGEFLPRDKAQMVKSLNPTLMIGDGANDAEALKNSEVGIAVKGSMQLALKSSHLFTTQSGLKVVDHLIELSRASVDLVKRNLKFSLIYNVVSTTLALTGYITPLMAAIIMPLSSVSVVLSTVLATTKLRQLETEGSKWKS
jgi:heavy metal translocating P-type ATPase